MNKNLHKIIFNKTRGCMMVVAENTTREGKSTQDSNGSSPEKISLFKSSVVLFSLFSFLQAQIVHAQVVADKHAPAGQQATILKTAAGAPKINIQTPNSKGLSHNRYTQFDIDAKGAVLNNSRTANPHLAKGAAKIILNEIRSNNPSKLGGVISIEGTKADVIIANPAGIQVNGGGFKNANRAVLTTGTPILKDGNLSGLDIRQGTVTIGQGGMSTYQGADYTEILSRAISVQGKLQASNQLTLSSGPQKIDYETGEITAGSAVGAKPVVGIDTAALGSMYSNSITLLANEKGAGVKNAGTINPYRQLIVTSAGRVENRGLMRTTADSTDTYATYLGIEATEVGSAGAVVSDGGRIESRGLLVIESGEDIGLRNGAVVQNTK